MTFEAFVAFRYLRAKRKQTFISLITLLSVAGVALGVCTLVVVLSVMSGFENQVKNKLLGMNAHLMVLGISGEITRPNKVMDRINQDPEVVAASPFVMGQVMVVAGGAASGVLLRGVELPQGLKVTALKQMMKSGKVEDLAKSDSRGLPGLALGSALAQQLGASIGSVVTLINPLGEDSPVGRVPKSEHFQVVGVFESGMYHYDTGLAYTSLAAAQELMDMGKAVSGVEVRVRDIYRAAEVGERLAMGVGPSVYSRDWMNMNQNLFAALKLEKLAMFIILTFIVLVAAFGIVSSLIMLVMEKTRDIAILKAMGATGKMIRRIFTLQGLIVGLCGTLLGLAGGLVLCALLDRYKFIELPKNVYPLSTLPVEVEPWLVALVGVSAVIICWLATLYPARVAGRLRPAEALRYE
jgi:lipoprotein-releasing system permease protein